MANQFFNIATKSNVGSTSVAATPSNAVGVISTHQSTLTFAAAPATVTVIWKVLSAAISGWANSTMLALALSIIVGMLIYWQSEPVNGTSKEKIIGFGFALINSFAIAATVLGISSLTNSKI